MRVASLLPSATEIVSALGHRGELVARSAECDYPPDVQSLPVLMRPRTWDANRRSAEIDARVRATRASGASLYALDVAALRSVRPDLLLTQDLCGVCSVTGEEVTAACREAGISPRVLSLAPRTLEEVWGSVEAVADALGDAPAGRSLAAALRERSRAVPTPVERRPRVAVVEWLDPPILAGLWTPEIIARAGGLPLGPEPGTVGQRTTWDEIARGAPDLVVVSPCSFSVERTRRELTDRRLRAQVRSTCGPRGIVLADEAYFSRPGPRLADGVALIRDLLAGAERPHAMPVEPFPAEPVGGTA